MARMRSSFCFLLFLGLLACRAERGPIRIGVSLSLREPGVLPMKLGVELAAREINAAGGIDGRPLELVERDDFAEEDTSVSIATDFYQRDVVAVIGGAYSGVTLAAAPVYNGGSNPLVQLSPSASSPHLTTAGDFTFRLCPSDLAYGAALAQFARDRGLDRAAVLYVNDEYGRGFRLSFAREFVRLGGSVLEVDPFLSASPDVGTYLARLARARQAGVIVLAANQEEGLPVVSQLRAANLNLPILAADGMVGAERTAADLMEGIYVSSAYLAAGTGAANRRFVDAYQRAYPEAGPPDQGAAASYDAVRLLARVIKEVGPDRKRVRDALGSVGNGSQPFEGAVGRVSFDINGDVPTLPVLVGVAKGGILVPVRSWR
ncbi:MAG TPA: ABC transporter substrate-binding protein [Gemmatimonadales bacterium]|nr:ABC transporter substrate-binding protein [Gemmatimonadales bacterium]